MKGEVKKVEVFLEGKLIGSRKNTRRYTHAVVNIGGTQVWSYHTSADLARKQTMRNYGHIGGRVVEAVVTEYPPAEVNVRWKLDGTNLLTAARGTLDAAENFAKALAKQNGFELIRGVRWIGNGDDDNIWFTCFVATFNGGQELQMKIKLLSHGLHVKLPPVEPPQILV